MFETILTEVAGRVGVIRLNRARKHNAINQQMMVETADALRGFEADDANTRAVAKRQYGKTLISSCNSGIA